MRPILAGVFCAVVFLLSVIWLDGGIRKYPQPGALMLDRVKLPLTAAKCGSDKECVLKGSPIAAYGEYRRCGGYIESARSGKSQVACSNSFWTDGFLSGGGEGNSFYRASRRACRSHDFCYLHGRRTYGARSKADDVRAACDDAFLADSVRDCTLQNPRSVPDAWKRRTCAVRSMAAYTAVWWFGEEHFSGESQKAVCDYEPGPRAARDQVVSGRFAPAKLDAYGSEQVMTLLGDGEAKSITIQLSAITASGAQAIAAPLVLRPEEIEIADRDAFCNANPKWKSATGECQVTTLADVKFEPDAWLRLAPIVVDADGNDLDEVLLVAVSADAGFIVTHVRTVRGADDVVGFLPVRAFAALDRWRDFRSPANSDTSVPGEFGQQLLASNFVVVERSPGGCEAMPQKRGAEDVMLMGARANRETDTIARRVFRLAFETEAWSMSRDWFTDDGHFMSSCEGVIETKTPNHTSRLQYPTFAVRTPVFCNETTTVMRESLAAIVRENCPSSIKKAQPGYLNDVDLMTYPVISQMPEVDSSRVFEMVKPSWLPLTWNEASDPVMTSRAARKAGVLMVSAYVGGSQDSRIVDRKRFMRPRFRVAHFPFISVLRAEPRLTDAVKRSWQQRLPDAVGLPASQYAVLESSHNSSRQYWNEEEFGNPRMFFELPTILAPFSIHGDDGLSVVLFANCTTFLEAHGRDCPDRGNPGEKLKGLVKDTVQVLIVPVVGLNKPPRWEECPAPKAAQLSPSALGSDLQLSRSFLHNEPVLPGHFFSGSNGGALAIAYRTSEGGIGFAPFRFVGTPKDGSWHLGDRPCTTLSESPNTQTVRNVWLSKLN